MLRLLLARSGDAAAGATVGCTNDQKALAARIKELVGRDEYPQTGLHDDIRFERHVRSYLRKLARMTKANEGFDKTLHHQ